MKVKSGDPNDEVRVSSSGCGAVILCSVTCQIAVHAPLFAQSLTYLIFPFKTYLKSSSMSSSAS